MTIEINSPRPPKQKSTVGKGLVLSLRRAALAGSVAVFALGVATVVGTNGSQKNAAHAELKTVVATQTPSFADVVEAVRPAVVSVRVKQTGEREDRVSNRRGDRDEFPSFRDLPDDHPMKRFFRRFGEEPRGKKNRRHSPRRFGSSQGSGFIVSPDGYVVTNNHVIDKGSDISVVLDDGTIKSATLIGKDSRTDLAVLKIEGEDTYDHVKFSDGDIRVGEWVVTMGNPFGLGGTVTAGIISARGRDIGAGPYDDFLQIDAAVNRGNSGGPAFALDGTVVGVNTAIFSPNGGNVGIAFAIPAATAKAVIEDLIKDGSVVRGWLGVQIQSVTQDIAESLGLDEDEGAIVSEVTENSPAEDAGFEPGDTVLAVNGANVRDPKDLARKVAAIDPGEVVNVDVWRDGERISVDVTIGTLPGQQTASLETPDDLAGPAPLEGLGLALAADDGAGAVIVDIDPDSNAAAQGLRSGDRILQINGVEVSAPGDVAIGVADAVEDGRGTVLVLVQSGPRSRFVALELKDA